MVQIQSKLPEASRLRSPPVGPADGERKATIPQHWASTGWSTQSHQCFLLFFTPHLVKPEKLDGVCRTAQAKAKMRLRKNGEKYLDNRGRKKDF